MRKAVLTILGLLNFDKAMYHCDGTDKEYTNTLPLLIEKYSPQNYDIRAIATKDALEIQKKVLQDKEKKSTEHLDDALILADTEAYDAVLEKMNNLLNEYDRVVVDISHGFRHMPILMMVNLIIQNISQSEKIELIWYAKEIVKNREYEMIDLAEYLQMASFAVTLSRFQKNYTIANSVTFKNENYQTLVKNLEDFSLNLLANSFKHLIEGENSLVKTILKEIEQLEQDKHIATFSHYLQSIKDHLNEIQSYADLSHFERLYRFSKLMLDKWYLLNAITLLNEAIGLYAIERFKEYNDDAKVHIGTKLQEDAGSYKAANEAVNFFKLSDEFKNAKVLNKETLNTVRKVLKKIEKDNLQNINSFKQLCKDVADTRNNLAHANSGNSIEDVQKKIATLLQTFHNLALEKDLLKKPHVRSGLKIVKKGKKDV